MTNGTCTCHGETGSAFMVASIYAMMLETVLCFLCCKGVSNRLPKSI